MFCFVRPKKKNGSARPMAVMQYVNATDLTKYKKKTKKQTFNMTNSYTPMFLSHDMTVFNPSFCE